MKIFIVEPPEPRKAQSKDEWIGCWNDEYEKIILSTIGSGEWEVLVRDPASGYSDELFGNGKCLALFNAAYSNGYWLEATVKTWTKAGFEVEIFRPKNLTV